MANSALDLHLETEKIVREVERAAQIVEVARQFAAGVEAVVGQGDGLPDGTVVRAAGGAHGPKCVARPSRPIGHRQHSHAPANAARMDAIREAVESGFEDATGISGATGISRPTVARALTYMASMGKVKRIGRGLYGAAR